MCAYLKSLKKSASSKASPVFRGLTSMLGILLHGPARNQREGQFELKISFSSLGAFI